MLATAARDVMNAGEGAEPGSGESLALRQILGAAAFHLAPRSERLRQQVEELREKLAETLHEGLSRALPDRDLDALARGLAGFEQPDVDLAGLTSRVEAAFETERVDVDRSRRLVAAAQKLADLTKPLDGPGRAPFGLVLAGSERLTAWAGAFPHNPFAVPATVAAPGEAGALARGVLAGQLDQTLDMVRTLRRARLELDRARGPKEEDLEALDRLAWDDLSAEEGELCPPVFLVVSESGAGVAGLLEVLAEDLPLKLAVLDDRLDDSAFNLALLAWTRPQAFFAQSSIAAPDHVEQVVAEAVTHHGPAFLRVHAPSPEIGGFAIGETVARAREALESKAFMLLCSQPGAADRPTLGGIVPAASPVEPTPAATPPTGNGQPYAARPDAAELAALEQRHAAELAALRGHYEAQIAGLRTTLQRETAQRVRGRLLELALGRPRPGAPEGRR